MAFCPSKEFLLHVKKFEKCVLKASAEMVNIAKTALPDSVNM